MHHVPELMCRSVKPSYLVASAWDKGKYSQMTAFGITFTSGRFHVVSIATSMSMSGQEHHHFWRAILAQLVRSQDLMICRCKTNPVLVSWFLVKYRESTTNSERVPSQMSCSSLSSRDVEWFLCWSNKQHRMFAFRQACMLPTLCTYTSIATASGCGRHGKSVRLALQARYLTP